MRADLEARFGEDLGTVRVHHDRESAEALGSRGFAIGEDIVTESTPTQSDTDRKLLAHEAAHVIEQRRGGRPHIARQEKPVVPQHETSYVTEDDGSQSLLIDGVKVLHYVTPKEHESIQINVASSSDHPNLIGLAVKRTSTVSALIDQEGVAELKRRGFDLLHYDVMDPADLSEHPMHLSTPPPRPQTRKLPAAKPKSKKFEPKPPVVKQPEIPAVDEQEQAPLPPLPVDKQPDAPPQQTPTQLIDQRTSWWGNLDEDALGGDLLKSATNGDPDYAQKVLDEVGYTDRDDVSLAFAQQATDEQLKTLASTERGRRLLDRLFDELTEGEVFPDEQQQADRILGIKTRSLLSEEQLAAGIAKAKRSGLILPYRKLGLTVWEPSPIYAYRLPDGKITVHLSNNIMGTSYARDPDLRFVWGDMILKEDEIVGVKRYDEGGSIEFMPALKLLQLTNEDTTRAFEKAGEAFGIGLTLGLGGEAAVGGEAAEGTTATATTGARVLAGARKGLAVADRLAAAIDIGNSLLQEHRGWVIETWPKEGREFVVAMDQITSYVRIYGITRGGIGLLQLGNSLRKGYKNWRAAAAAMKQLSESETRDIEQIGSQTEKLLQELDSTVRQESMPHDEPGGAEVHDISEARQRAAGDAHELQSMQAANDNIEVDQPMLRASGDIETRAMAGPRGPGKPPVQPQRGTTRTTTTTRGPTRGGGGGGSGVVPPTRPQPRLVLPEHLEEPKLLPRGIDNYTNDEVYNFFLRNRASYPRRVRDMIDNITIARRTSLEAIEKELKEHYARQANFALGFPTTSRSVSRPAPVPGGRVVEESSPFTSARKGHVGSEGAVIEGAYTPTPQGQAKNLNFVGHTKDGETLEIDDFNFQRRHGVEIKMPYALQHDPKFRANPDKIIDQMRRQYKFSRDWGFGRYHWDMLTEEDALTALRYAREYLPDDWYKFIRISSPAVPDLF